jgi:hypothetical protein
MSRCRLSREVRSWREVGASGRYRSTAPAIAQVWRRKSVFALSRPVVGPGPAGRLPDRRGLAGSASDSLRSGSGRPSAGRWRHRRRLDRNKALGEPDKLRVAKQRRLQAITRRTPFGAPIQQRQLSGRLCDLERARNVTAVPGDLLLHHLRCRRLPVRSGHRWWRVAACQACGGHQSRSDQPVSIMTVPGWRSYVAAMPLPWLDP